MTRWPIVVAQPLEPGGTEWEVVVDNAHAPQHTWEVIVPGPLTEERARQVAAAWNVVQALQQSDRRISVEVMAAFGEAMTAEEDSR